VVAASVVGPFVGFEAAGGPFKNRKPLQTITALITTIATCRPQLGTAGAGEEGANFE